MDKSLPKYPFTVTLEAGGTFHIVFPDLPGCMSGAESWDEIVPNAQEALVLWLKTAEEIGKVPAAPTIGTDTDYPWRYPLNYSATPTYSTSEVAARLGVSARRVQAIARDRHIGRRVGRTLFFSPTDVECMKVRKPGRPRQRVKS